MAKGFIDAALNGEGDYAGKTYFFKGDQYVRYDWAKDRVDPGYAQPIANWYLTGNFASGIDAALNGYGKYAGKAYFFKGDKYLRYDWAQDLIEPGYPQPITKWNLPAGFTSNFDTAVNGRSTRAGKAYFFKGAQYARYDWAQDRVDQGYPQSITKWVLTGGFISGFDAAVSGQGNYANKAYFFKESGFYDRYDWGTGRGDPGYPLSIVKYWRGVAEILGAGRAKAKALEWIASGIRQQFENYLKLKKPNALVESALKTHFHVEAHQLAVYAPMISQTYLLVLNAMNSSPNIFRYRTDAEAVADKGVDKNGVPFPAYTVHNQNINFTTSFPQFGPLCQAAMVLHEFVHYVDSKASKDVYEHEPQYAKLTSEQAVHNPSSYVCFAQHLFYGKDERYGAGRPKE